MSGTPNKTLGKDVKTSFTKEHVQIANNYGLSINKLRDSRTSRMTTIKAAGNMKYRRDAE